MVAVATKGLAYGFIFNDSGSRRWHYRWRSAHARIWQQHQARSINAARPRQHARKQSNQFPASGATSGPSRACRTGATAVGYALVAIGLASCTLQQPQIEYREVDVPRNVYVQCTIEKPKLPSLPIARLSVASTPDITIGAYEDTVLVLKGAVRERDAIINKCTKQTAAAVKENPDANK